MDGSSVLETQVALNGGIPAVAASPPRSNTPTAAIGEFIDNTPKFLGGMVLGAALTLLLLRVFGFRFSFGAELGGGS